MQPISTKEYQTRHDWSGQGDPRGIVQEVYIRLYEQMVFEQPRIFRENEMHRLNLGHKTRPSNSQKLKKKKKENNPICGFRLSRMTAE